MQLEASKLLLGSEIPKSKLIIQSSINVLREGMNNTRNTLKNIKPPSEELGINKVKLLVKEFSLKS
ncbi:MAG: hypothetical protein MUO60_18690 [Clostridiaceae bacterium]|nr:hypothetical protein [Clostridiaceae bacterium]